MNIQYYFTKWGSLWTFLQDVHWTPKPQVLFVFSSCRVFPKKQNTPRNNLMHQPARCFYLLAFFNRYLFCLRSCPCAICVSYWVNTIYVYVTSLMCVSLREEWSWIFSHSALWSSIRWVLSPSSQPSTANLNLFWYSDSYFSTFQVLNTCG